MAVLSYSTKVAVRQSIREIEDLLTDRFHAHDFKRHGQLDDPTALEFRLPTKAGDLPFYFRADSQGVYARLAEDNNCGRIPRSFVTREQAKRVFWRIIKRWIESHLELVESGALEPERAMAPYFMVPNADGTARPLHDVFQVLAATGAVLLPERVGTRDSGK